VTETTAGERTSATTYACAGRGAQIPIDATATSGWSAAVGAATAENADDPCATSGPQATPVALGIVDPSQEATVTVTNTLVEPAAAVSVTPRFTG
jgi:hypothetical protein